MISNFGYHVLCQLSFKPLFSVFLPHWYPNLIEKMFLNHDKASSHTANLTTGYMAKMKVELDVSYISKEEIHVKTPDGSPRFFLIRLWSRDFKSEEPEHWIWFGSYFKRSGKMSIRNAFNSWKRRVWLISARYGAQIEQKKVSIEKLHKKLLNKWDITNLTHCKCTKYGFKNNLIKHQCIYEKKNNIVWVKFR